MANNVFCAWLSNHDEKMPVVGPFFLSRLTKTRQIKLSLLAQDTWLQAQY